jgi:aryl-alcohol dehydrogenase-like predicted oxidoreductase
MDRVTLGATGLVVSPICFGCWQMGQTYWGKVPEGDLIDAVRAALDAGINFFDTADAYGDGEAERILGRALKGVRRDNFVIATKVYHHFHPDGHRHPDLSYDYVLAECDASLQRLGLDCIDLYQCHSFDPFTPLEETARAMEALVKAGRIRAYGVSNFTVEQLRASRKVGRFNSLQPYYNLLEPEAEEDRLPYCQVEEVGVLVYSPLLRGLLTGKFKGSETFDDLRGRDKRFAGDAFKELIAKVEKLRPIAAAKGCTVTQLSLAATVAHPAIHCAIAGIKNAAQAREAASAMSVSLTREEYHQVRRALS